MNTTRQLRIENFMNRMQQMDVAAELVRKELGLSPEARYDVLSVMYEGEQATKATTGGLVGMRLEELAARATLKVQVAELQSELEELRSQLEWREALQQALVAHAVGNNTAMFILSKVVEAGTLDLDTLTRNLKTPFGWIAFAQLWRAHLIDCYGEVVVPTDFGANLIRRLKANHSLSNLSDGNE